MNRLEKSHQRLAVVEGPTVANDAETRKQSHYPELPEVIVLSSSMLLWNILMAWEKQRVGETDIHANPSDKDLGVLKAPMAGRFALTLRAKRPELS